jgi:endonuclease/exonuclease/phosphatase family metal-dependent hydrolase
MVAAFAPAQTVRFATFNTAFSDAFGVDAAGRLAEKMATTGFQNAQVVAEIIQRTRPDVILLNEFDTDLTGASYRSFQDTYLGVSQNGAEPIHYEHVYAAESNTGLRSGVDFNNNNSVNNPDDSFGFGNYAGEYGMVVLSRYPILNNNVRTFQKFLWKDMPDSALPTDYYSDEAQAVFRLSSKSHWDLPIQIGGEIVHFLVAHPTPPAFDGPEDRNGRRNHDEIRFWADYIRPGAGDYIYDDTGVKGGLAAGAKFVIAGDYNADPLDGDSFDNAISQLLDSPLVNTSRTPTSAGAVEDSATEGGLNNSHQGNPALDTSDFNPSTVGNLRVDYVLAASTLTVKDTAVFWPEQASEFGRLTPNFPNAISDHRLVWADVVVPEPNGYLLMLLAIVGLFGRISHSTRNS